MLIFIVKLTIPRLSKTVGFLVTGNKGIFKSSIQRKKLENSDR